MKNKGDTKMSEEIKNTEEEVKEEQTVETTESDKKENKKTEKKKDDKKSTKTSATKESKKDEQKDKTKPLLAIIFVLVLVLIGLCAYVISNSKKSTPIAVETGQAVNKSVLIDAMNNLKKKDSFIISTYINAPVGNTSYIEYVAPNMSATLVDESNIETPYQQIDKTTAQYRYNDLIKDGHMYFFYDNTDEEGNPITEVYKAPDEYAKECGIRSYMFFDLMKDDIQDLEFVETTTGTDLGNGPVNMNIYKGKIASSIVKRILGNGTVVLYDTVRKNTDNEGMKKMMGWLIDDIDFTMQYSDANAIFGVVDDTLVYINLEIGGLGTKMYVTKCFIEDTSVATNIAEPSIEGAIDYETLYASYADMALEYDSMEDLYNAIYNQSNALSEEELQQILDNAVKSEEETSGRDIETEVIKGDGQTTEESATEETTTETTATE